MNEWSSSLSTKRLQASKSYIWLFISLKKIQCLHIYMPSFPKKPGEILFLNKKLFKSNLRIKPIGWTILIKSIIGCTQFDLPTSKWIKNSDQTRCTVIMIGHVHEPWIKELNMFNYNKQASKWADQRNNIYYTSILNPARPSRICFDQNQEYLSDAKFLSGKTMTYPDSCSYISEFSFVLPAEENNVLIPYILHKSICSIYIYISVSACMCMCMYVQQQRRWKRPKTR